METTSLLLIGDIFGRPGRKALAHFLPILKRERHIDLVVANAENAAGGKGITADICSELFGYGVDIITTGNHLGDKKEIREILSQNPRILRPYNFFTELGGNGSVVIQTRKGTPVGVINAMGSVHMREVPSPFSSILSQVHSLQEKTKIILLDFHAEATSEKRAMGWYLDGQISALIGTHTHVPTADEEILPQGTAYLTDVGMTGPYESVIGLRTDLALGRFLRQEKGHFDVGKGDVRFCGVLLGLQVETGKAVSIERILRKMSPTGGNPG